MCDFVYNNFILIREGFELNSVISQVTLIGRGLYTLQRHLDTFEIVIFIRNFKFILNERIIDLNRSYKVALIVLATIHDYITFYLIIQLTTNRKLRLGAISRLSSS